MQNNNIAKMVSSSKAKTIAFLSLLIGNACFDLLTSNSKKLITEIPGTALDIATMTSCIYMFYDTITQLHRIQKSKEYQEIQNRYQDILQGTKTLFNTLNLENPIHIFAIYSYMLKKGYFSFNKDFAYSSHTKSLLKLYGADIICGRGVCKNIGWFLSDIYNTIEMKSYPLTVYTSDETLKLIEDISDIEMKDNNDISTFSEMVYDLIAKLTFSSNHLMTFVSHNGKSYFLDATNDCAFKAVTYRKISLLNNEDGQMIIKNLGDIPLNSASIRDFKRVKSLLLQPTISYEEFRQLYFEGEIKSKQNEDLFQDFYNKNQRLYTDINEKMSKIPSL